MKLHNENSEKEIKPPPGEFIGVWRHVELLLAGFAQILIILFIFLISLNLVDQFTRGRITWSLELVIFIGFGAGVSLLSFVFLAFLLDVNSPDRADTASSIFFSLEIPFIILCSARLILGELNYRVQFLFHFAWIGLLWNGYQLIFQTRESKNSNSVLLCIGWSCFFISVLYFTSLCAFFTPVLFFLNSNAVGIIVNCAIWCFFSSLFKNCFQFVVKRKSAIAILILVFMIWYANVFTFKSTHAKTLSNFRSVKECTDCSPNDVYKLLDQREAIREALLDNYLREYRYLLSMKDDQSMRRIYPKMILPIVEKAWFFMISPFALDEPQFKDKNEKEPQFYGKMYHEFFDNLIEKHEREQISNARASRFFVSSDASSTLNDINATVVLLESQEINIEDKGNYFDVEIHEVYENEGNMDVEVLYYFEVPESLTFTEVWLGDPGSSNKTYRSVVSPKGAAQKVYKEQVYRRVDPALLEQVGPNQYRLKIFPVPIWDSLHAWYRYHVVKNPSTKVTPKVIEKRNVYWDRRTTLTVNRKVQSIDKIYNLEFLSNYFDQNITSCIGDYSVSSIPYTSVEIQWPNIQLAVIVDTSLSMEHLAETVKEELCKLNNMKTGNVDFYLTTSPYWKQLKPKIVSIYDILYGDIQYFGGSNLNDMILQFIEISGQKRYDLIALITDSKTYDADSKSKNPITLDPLYIVNLEAGMSSAYEDKILKAIERGGNGRSIKEVIEKQYWANKGMELSDGRLWTFQEDHTNSCQADNFSSQIASKQLINHLLRVNDNKGIEFLDNIHKIAKREEIVTTYSSMIVLVNEAQKKSLEKEESKEDRFEREMEVHNGRSLLFWNSGSILSPKFGLLTIILISVTFVLF